MSSVQKTSDKAVVGEGREALSATGKSAAPRSVAAENLALNINAVSQAWATIEAGRRPESVTAVAKTQKCAVLRLGRAGRDGQDVIAARCKPTRAGIEESIFNKIAQNGDFSHLHFYGSAPDPMSDHRWLFMEDAAGDSYSAADPTHRKLAGRWLAKLHLWGAGEGRALAGRLRHQQHDYHRRRLNWCVRKLEKINDNNEFMAALSRDDAASIEDLLSQSRFLAEQWLTVTDYCTALPQTVVHGDFSIQNLRVRRDGGAARLVAFDWEDSAWAAPAIDLLQYDRRWSSSGAGVDLNAYCDAVSEQWQGVRLEDVTRQASIGRIFWQISAMQIDLKWLDLRWPDRRLRNLRTYSDELSMAMSDLGWNEGGKHKTGIISGAGRATDDQQWKAMNICLVSAEYPPQTAHGGIASQTYLKAHGLSALGHRVQVISRSPDAMVHAYNDGPVQVMRIPGMDYRFPIYTQTVDWLTYSAQVAAALSDLHQRKPFDLVDFPEWSCEGYVHLLNRSEWENLPAVIHLHGPLVMFAHAIGWPEFDSEFYRMGKEMEGACLRMADQVFSSSRCSAEWCAKYYGVAADQIPVLHMGIDQRVFYPRPVEQDKRPTIVFIGKLSDHKGASMLVEAAARLAAAIPGIKLKMIGACKPEQKERLIRLAAAANALDMLEFTGFVNHADLPDHMSRAHVFAAPSAYEGGPGFVYLEAMACGLPVIGCTGSGSSEVIEPGVTGLLVPPHDRDALAEALRSLLVDPERARSMGQAGVAYVGEHADSQKCAKRLEVFYASVVQRRASLRSGGA